MVNRRPGPFYSLVPRVRSRARFSTTSPWRRLLLFLCLLSGEFVFSDGQAGGEVLRMQQLASEVSSLRTFVLTFFFSGGCGHGGLFSGVQQVSLPVLHISFGICVGVGAGVVRSLCFIPVMGWELPVFPVCGSWILAVGCFAGGGGQWAVAGRCWTVLPVFTDGGDGRCAWEAIYSASSPSNKSSSAVSTLWTSSLVQTAAIVVAPADVRNRGRRREDPEIWCEL